MRRFVVLLLALLLAAAGCGSGDERGAGPTTSAGATTRAPATSGTRPTPVPTTTAPATTAPATTAPATAPTTTAPPAPTTAPATTAPPAPTTAPTTTAPPAPTTAAPTTAPAAPATVVRVGSTSAPVVTLTFDAGSDAGSAQAILAILAGAGVPATFFVTGRFADTYPGVVTAIAAAGHRVGNHSATHPSFTGFSTGTEPLSPAAMADQLRRADASISARTGRTTKPLFRPPYGDRSATVDAVLGAEGYRYDVLWTVDTLGWQGVDPSVVVARCLGGARAGAILMFHVGTGSTDAAALPDVIAGLRSAGYGFAPLEALLP